MPASTLAAARNDMKSLHCLAKRLIARWSCSTMLLRYFTCQTVIGAAGAIDFVDPGLIGAALIHRDLLRRTVPMDGLSMKRLAAAMS